MSTFQYRSYSLGKFSLSVEFLPRKVDTIIVKRVAGEIVFECFKTIITISKNPKPKLSWH